jgi:hypothetical protein
MKPTAAKRLASETTKRRARADKKVRNVVEVTVEYARQKAAQRGTPISDAEFRDIVGDVLDAFRIAQAEVGREAIDMLPSRPVKSFAEHYPRLRELHRANFKIDHGRKPIARNDVEDYTPVKFFHEVWADYVQAGVVTAKYLERVDPELYNALVAYVRGCNEGRAGRQPITLEEIGIKSQRDLMGRFAKAEREAT